MDTNRNLDKQSRTIIRNLNLSCPQTTQLNTHFNDSVISLAFHKDILKENLDCILNLSTCLQAVILDNIKILFRDTLESKLQIKLVCLKQMNISIANQQLVPPGFDSTSRSTLPNLNPDTVTMFNYLKRITYGALEEINIDCTLEQLCLLPLPAPFVPDYIIEVLDSLTELLYNNRCTLHHLTIGPEKEASKKLILEIYPPVDDPNNPKMEEKKECEDRPAVDENHPAVDEDHPAVDHTFKSITEIPNRQPTQFSRMTTVYDLPFPEWWVGMLVYQNTLKKLSITLTDEKVLNAVLEAAVNSSETLEELHIRIIGNSGIEIDLEKLGKCTKMESFGLTAFESEVSVQNSRFLPESILDLTLSGIFCDSAIGVMVKAVPNVKNLLISLNKSEYPDSDTFSVVNWPAFTSVMDFLHLERLVIHSQHLHLNWDEIVEWSKTMDWCIGVTNNPSEEPDTEEIVMQIVPIVEAKRVESPVNTFPLEENSGIVSALCNCIGF